MEQYRRERRLRPAGIRLFFAVEQAVAWTREPIEDHEDWEEKMNTAGTATQAPVDVAAAWMVRSTVTRGDCPHPERDYNDAAAVSYLFVALRFAFLQDADMLPAALRRVVDPASGRQVLVKTPEKAARIRGKPYSFAELWDAFTDEIQRKLALLGPKATGSDRSKVKHIDLEARRSANALRKLPSARQPRDVVAAETMLSSFFLHGCLAA